MLKAYFDESGFDGPGFTLCGLIGTEEMWKAFEQKWTQLLQNPCPHANDQIKPKALATVCRPLEYLHAQEMEGLGIGRFRRIGQRNRDYLIVNSVNVMLSCGLLAVATGVEIGAYNRLPPEVRQRTGSPYLMCMRYVLHTVAEKASMFIGENEDIAYIFEDQPKWEIEAHTLYASLRTVYREQYRMGTIAFGAKAKFKPLQAADRLAYETYQHFADRTKDRDVWTRFVQYPLLFGQYCNEDGLTGLAEAVINM